MPNPPPDPNSFLDILRAERRDLLNRLRQTRFSTKPGYSQTQIIPFSSYSPWLDDTDFAAVHESISDCTLVDIYRCYELFALARQIHSVPGDLVEVGVWRGGTAVILAAAAREKPIHLFDTFTGVAKADHAYDTLYAGGEHGDADRATVEALFRRMGFECRIHRGVFPDDTLASLPPRVALAHVDVDTYASAKESFTAIWPVVSAGGVMIFDDCGFFGCEGVTQVVNELRTTLDDALFVHNLNGHALLVKK